MVKVTLPISGGCLCGNIRFEATAQPIWIGYCHCKLCQQASGGPFILFVDFMKHEIEFSGGSPKIYRSSEWGERGFCSDCGAPLFFQYVDLPQFNEFRRGLIGFSIGCFDDPTPYQATEHQGVESRLPNVSLVDDLPCSRADDDEQVKAVKSAMESAGHRQI